MIRLLTVVAAGVLLTGCPSSGSAPAPDLDAERRAILETDRAFCRALRAGDAASFASFLDDGAVFFGSTISRGPEEVLERWRPLLGPDAPIRLTWEPEEVRVSAAGDLGYTIGRYRMESDEPSGSEAARNGSYVTIWNKTGDGSWKAIVDIGTPPEEGTD